MVGLKLIHQIKWTPAVYQGAPRLEYQGYVYVSVCCVEVPL